MGRKRTLAFTEGDAGKEKGKGQKRDTRGKRGTKKK